METYLTAFFWFGLGLYVGVNATYFGMKYYV